MSEFKDKLQTKHQRQIKAKDVEAHPSVEKVLTAEEFTVPGKSAAFSPYDTVLLLYLECSDVRTLQIILDEYGVHYDRVINVIQNDMYYDCSYIGYVSLV